MMFCNLLMASTFLVPCYATTEVGAAGIGPKYQFTGAPATAEEAHVMRDMGARVHKFALTPPVGQTLLQFWQSDPATVQITSMAFDTLVFWALPAHPPGTDATAYAQQNYDEIRELVVFLRTAYQGSGKRFFLGNWEGDNMLTALGTKVASGSQVQQMTRWFNARQAAVDDAKAATWASSVEVWHYVEMNFVTPKPLGSPIILTAVLPNINPDFVSYSSWQSLWHSGCVSQDCITLKADLPKIAAALPAKASVPYPQRVFVGEFGFKDTYWGAAKQATMTQAALDQIKTFGAPLALYWAVYDNTGDGYQIVDNHGAQRPVYSTLQGSM